MNTSKNSFRARVEELVGQIPEGRVMTYGQLAALCGNARAARIVGGIAHFGATYLHTNPDCPFARQTVPQDLSSHDFVDRSSTHSPSARDGSFRASRSSRPAYECEGCGGQMMPWQRVVNKSGGLAAGYPGGRRAHRQHLEEEGVAFKGEVVVMEEHLWHP